jgi:peptide/nickel transport system permease protein
MAKHIVKQLLVTIAVLVMVMVTLTLLTQIIPGDAAKTILGPRATSELVAKLRAAMNLDKSAPEQVLRYADSLLHGDLGTDVFSGRSINSLVAVALPHTLALTFSGLFLALILGIPLGTWSATHPDSLADRITSVLSISLVTIPSYVAGLVLLLVFAVKLRILPAIGAGDLGDPVDYLRHLILPAVALALSWVGYLARLVRTSVMEVLNEDYIRAARAGGLSEGRIRYRYALKNALIPTVSVVSVGIGNLRGGAVFLEGIFTRPGMGLVSDHAIQSRNYPIVRAGVLLVALIFALVIFLADVGCAVLDPRIRLNRKRD